MLLRFGAGNHRSIHDYQELLLSASKATRAGGLVMPVPTLREAAVPVVAIYGANAAGKSNLIDAMDQLRRHVVRSHVTLEATDPIPRDPFGLDGDGGLTRLDCTFTLGGRGGDEGTRPGTEDVYEYGFEYTEQEYRREWLYRIVRNERLSTQTLFERETESGKVHVGFKGHLRGENRTIANLTRPNSLFLSASAQNNHPQLSPVYTHFARRWTVISGERTVGGAQVAEWLSNYDHFDRLSELVRQADVGIDEIDVDEDEVAEDEIELMRDIAQTMTNHLERSGRSSAPSDSLMERMRRGKRLYFIHSGVGGKRTALDYETQSKGTRTLVTLLIPALEALAKGALLVVDELDTSLHPNLAQAFVSLFTKPESNPYGAQLVFTTHDVTLLAGALLRRDEIWMADKDRQGASTFTPLSDFKLRSRDDIERAYRNGRLGGVPFGNDFVVDVDDVPPVVGP